MSLSEKPDVFGAVADPTRRRILQLLRDEERTMGWIADRFDVTAPAISQHLRVLREAGLVEYRKEGRHRYYAARPVALEPLMDWLSYFDALWDQALVKLGDHLRIADPDVRRDHGTHTVPDGSNK